MKPYSLALLIGLLSLLLACCQSTPSTKPPAETQTTIEAATPNPPGDNLLTEDYDQAAYPGVVAVLWADGFLWTANETGLLTRWDVKTGHYQQHRLPGKPASTINDFKRAPDGSLWMATASGVFSLRNGVWNDHRLGENLPEKEAFSLGIGKDNSIWVAGQGYIARINSDEMEQVYRVIDNPLLSDRIGFVVLDDESQPWFIGRRGKLHFDGQAWIAYDADVRRFALFNPIQPPAEIFLPARDFPSPTKDYIDWLKVWPRPQADNGRGMHFLQTHQFDTIEAQKQVNRLKKLGVRWALVHYVDHNQLRRTAPIFQEAGITVVWRPFIRPYERYDSWAEDVEYLRSRGLAPYIQLYNEPSLRQEWDNRLPIDQETYWRNLLPAAQQVYDSGGMKAREMNHIFDRLFFVPHLYGLNHPPNYDEDINSVLGFREFARVFEEEIGFVPVMIAGEGGWRLGEAPDNRYPAITEELHRDYHRAVFDWFGSGELGNGEALSDYFFAFCPWLISDPNDPAAWFDSASGDRRLTIEAIEAMPTFERKFSWNE
jgi:hypothetical protein